MRRHDPVGGGPLRIAEWHHNALVDDVLLVMHSGQALPEVARQHAATKRVERVCLTGSQCFAFFPVGGGVTAGVAGSQQPFGHLLFLSEQVGDRRNARVDESILKMGEKCRGHSLTAMIWIDG